MKHVVMMGLVVLAVVSLLGCAGQEVGDVTEEERPTPAVENGTVDVTFSITLEKTAEKVFVAGNFNSWIPNDARYALTDEDGDGTWEAIIQLEPGTYQYKFVVDNEWILPPDTPSTIDDGFGGKNGFIEVQQ